MPETFFTVWTNLFDRGRLAAGEGCSSTAARAASARRRSSWRRARGARVFATAGTDEKCAACVRLGADAGDRTTATHDWVEGRCAGHRRPRRRRDPRHGRRRLHGAEPAGAGASTAGWCRSRFSRASTVELDIALLMRKRLCADRLDAAAADAGGEGRDRASLEAEVWPLLARARRGAGHRRGATRSPSAPLAHQRMESSAHMGKIVLDVRA